MQKELADRHPTVNSLLRVYSYYLCVCEVRLVYQCLRRHVQNGAMLFSGEVLNAGRMECGLTEITDLSNAPIFVHQHVLCCQVTMEYLWVVLMEEQQS